MNNTALENKLTELISASTYHMEVMRAVRQLDLPDCWIGAGFVRNHIWDHLHGYTDITPLNDIDVIYFDPDNISKDIEKEYDAALENILSGRPWSVKNQARMWQVYGNEPYTSTEDGLRNWTEKATAVAVRLNNQDDIEVLAPFGLKENFDMTITPTPRSLSYPEQYNQRLDKKSWQKTWPKVEITRL
jgi:hypothetical protein